MRFRPIGFSLMTTVTLTGCITPYQTNFDCPVPLGVPCTSMSKVNHMIDKGLLGKPEEDCTCKKEVDQPVKEEPLLITFFEPELKEPISVVPMEQKLETVPSEMDSIVTVGASEDVHEDVEVISADLSIESPEDSPEDSIEEAFPAEFEDPETTENDSYDELPKEVGTPSIEIVAPDIQTVEMADNAAEGKGI